LSFSGGPLGLKEIAAMRHPGRSPEMLDLLRQWWKVPAKSPDIGHSRMHFKDAL